MLIHELCPICPPVTNRRGNICGHWLEVVEQNYSGCDVDIYECTSCGKMFEVSYKVDKIKLINPNPEEAR